MRFTYDDQVDALYVYLREGRLVASSVEIDPGRVVDLDAEEHAIGVEVLGASNAVRLTDLVDRFDLEDLRRNLRVLETTPFHRPERA